MAMFAPFVLCVPTPIAQTRMTNIVAFRSQEDPDYLPVSSFVVHCACLFWCSPGLDIGPFSGVSQLGPLRPFASELVFGCEETAWRWSSARC
jgi:hypothetical protein